MKAAADGLIPGYVDTWISLPKHRRPKAWDSFHDPVTLFRRKLYGHPLAGFFWEKFVVRVLKECGFVKVEGWESLFVHREQQLFLSIYVDDIKLAGRKENLMPMLEQLSKHLDLDPPVPLENSVYLGCGQQAGTPSPADVEKNRLRFAYVTSSNTADDATILEQLKAVSHIPPKQPKFPTPVSTPAPAFVCADTHAKYLAAPAQGG